MNTAHNTSRFLRVALAPLLAAALLSACGGDSTTDSGPAPAPVNSGPAGASPVLGTSSTYGIFASSAAITLAANSSVNGDVGLNPAAACNNCVVGVTVLNGVVHNGDQAAIDAQTAFNAAYVDAANRTTNACTLVNSELSQAQAACAGVTNGPVYVPGLYRSANPIGVGSTFNITLDAGGNPDAVFIFQTNAALTTGTSSTVTLAGGAQAKNVWWMAGSAATLGVSSTFKGTVIANGAAVQVLGGTALNPTVVEGRLFSHAAGVVLDTFSTVTVPQ
ncbi:MAG: ice-binding family protein [Hylemonella sp.]|uniref:ice-binding family protein n=1 Tax=Hylemonella sp. TaxID=2066020 RepID=UPI0022BD54D3|nr:ice-binding family protein [Hylemonella sp.]MCZ8252316.1 ice-binding family protein [Hylemonella sp.]